jgi:glycerol-3-phosphate dehydrogenase (NAD(P)+)
MRFSVLGAGGWGTAIARLLALGGHDTFLWARRPEHASSLAETRENERYLPGVLLPAERLTITADLRESLDADALFLAVPSFAINDLLSRIAPSIPANSTLINLAKGLERSSRQTASELIEDRLPKASAFALSGPSHAEEVGRDIPTAVVLAGKDLSLGERLQREIATPRFRVYLSSDVRGVELCAALKNVIALATGISDGLGYGDNSRGALITRGLTEMARFGRTLGIKEKTLFGLAGLGDLVATCTSQHSRNRYVGCRLGAGDALETILGEMSMVAEGVYATGIVFEMARERGIEMPITEAVASLLAGEVDPPSLVERIMTRDPKREDG